MLYRAFAEMGEAASKQFYKVGRTFKRPTSAIRMANKYGKSFVLNEEGKPIYARGFSNGIDSFVSART